MSRKELLQTIQDIENGLAMNPTGEILERLTNRLTRAKNNLALLEKKSESQPIEKEQVQQSQRQEETARAIDWEKREGINTTLTAPQPKALTKLPAPTKPIKWANGDVKEMNELDLRRKSVDYFGDVLNGKRLPSDFYRSMQFNNLVRFQIGLYRFGHPIMAHTALHPTYNMCEKKTQDRSLELFRQVHDMWIQYKDTDIV